MVIAQDVAALCHELRLRVATALAELSIRKTAFTHAPRRLLCDTLWKRGERWTCPTLTMLELDMGTFNACDCVWDDIVHLASRRSMAASAPEDESPSQKHRGYY
ncbi:hypothetical protein AURDEDRAFT_124766 [Auricularia subglabra TFB-10046 SS5]|nr:hypothetical protein AURDEDRAFT_124766 [Auricularia subglabra TFB-10046 SS5]